MVSTIMEIAKGTNHIQITRMYSSRSFAKDGKFLKNASNRFWLFFRSYSFTMGNPTKVKKILRYVRRTTIDSLFLN